MKQNLSFLFGKDHPAVQEKSFIVLPGQNCIRITIDTSLKQGLYTVLYVYAPSHCLRAMRQVGYGERILQIGEEIGLCSSGACPGLVKEGTWTIRAVIYNRIEQSADQEAALLLTISEAAGEIGERAGEEQWMNQDGTIVFPERSIIRCTPGWYAGDFHVHTHLSDGQETMTVQNWKAEFMGLSFFMVTEHNVMPFSWMKSQILAIPSIEITSSEGHCNLFGLHACVNDPDRCCWDHEHADALLSEAALGAHRQNALVSINHPFLSPWSWQHEDFQISELDCLEVINDPTYPDNQAANQNAIALLDCLWNDGYQITALGGSDTHRKLDDWYPGADGPSIIGDPATWVYCSVLSAQAILDGVRAGHTMISRNCVPSVCLLFQNMEILPGSEVRGSGQLRAEIILQKCRRPLQFYAVYDGVRTKLSQHQDMSERTCMAVCSMQWESGAHWLRFEAADEDGMICFLTNPVFSGRKEHAFKTIGEAMAEIRAQEKL